MQSKKLAFAWPLVMCAVACAPSAVVDENEREPVPLPTAEFDPGSGVIPIPTNLVLNPTTGVLNIPAQCGESETAATIREGILNQLDGYGTFRSTLRATFSAPVDVATLEGRVFMFRIQRRGVTDDPTTAPPIPLAVVPSQAQRYDADCQNPAAVDAVVFAPMVPLDVQATYVVAVLDGAKTADGELLFPSSVWSLVRQKTAPVEVAGEGEGEDAVITRNATPFDASTAEGRATLLGLATLWSFHNTFLPFLDAAVPAQLGSGESYGRERILLAWSFNTQTVMAPLDPTVEGGPAAGLATVTSNATMPVDFADQPAPNVMEGVLCAAQGAEAPCGACASHPCAAVGAVKVGAFSAPGYQVLQQSVPTVWDSARTPTMQREENIGYLAFVPAGEKPASGWPVVVFSHGITRQKGDLFVIAAQLANAGVASIAIDTVAHGDRAVQISTAGVCADNPIPGTDDECFAPFSSSNLAVMRDNVRQTVLDHLKLIEVVKQCGVDNCGEFSIDPARIGFMGQSLGAIIGSTTVAVSPDIRAAVFNVGGVGWVDVSTYTQNPGYICPTIDTLIEAGILSGELWNDGANDNALCLTDTWRTDPGFLAFANTARWILDPADGANFAGMLRVSDKKVLIQKVVGDMAVPNEATDQFGALLGLQASSSRFYDGDDTPRPTEAVTFGTSAWVDYETRTQGKATNSYSHGSLLAPAAGAGGSLGTAQMQTDAITFLVTNLQ